MNILCKLGIHKWKQSRFFHILDIHPLLYSNYKSPERKCERCGKMQEWLPGYGGSEIGCWLSQKRIKENNMKYICPDLICPYCKEHTFYVIGEFQFWVSEQTCQNCGKTFKAIMNLRDTPVKSYESSSGKKIDLENDVFISFNCYIPSKREEELCKIEENKDG